MEIRLCHQIQRAAQEAAIRQGGWEEEASFQKRKRPKGNKAQGSFCYFIRNSDFFKFHLIEEETEILSIKVYG